MSDEQKQPEPENKEPNQLDVGPSQPPARHGGLILPDQILPPNLFILPINGPVAFPTLLSPLLITQPRYIAMIEEAINRQRMVGLLVTREGEVREGTKPEDLYDVGVVVKIIKR